MLAYGRLWLPPPMRVRRVDVEEHVAAVALRADVGDVDGDVEREPAFVGHVPRLDRAAIDVTRLGRPHGDGRPAAGTARCSDRVRR